MPASMMMASVALRPKVIGKRMLMPDSGPMPGSTPTRVPMRQPIKAYQRLLGCSATEKPCKRLTKVPSMQSLEPEPSGGQRRFENEMENDKGEGGHKDAVEERGKDVPSLNQQQQRQHCGCERDHESE